MTEYQPFPITEFKTALNTYLKPWIRPQDAFEPLVNAYVYRGVLTKRNGSTVFGNQLGDMQPVMGIMQYLNESTGATKLVVASTKGAYLYTAGATPDGGTFAPLVTVGGTNSVFWQGTATGTIPIPTFWPNFANGPGTIFITDGIDTVSFAAAVAGVGAMTGAAGIFVSGSIVYATGVVTLTFSGSHPNTSLSIRGTLTTPNSSAGYFTGNIRNFFNWTNWQPTSSITAISVSYLYMTNNVDQVTIFDGTNLARPVFYVDNAKSGYITKSLDIKTYSNRLLMIRPTLLEQSNSVSVNQSIYFSALFSPFNFIGDVPGNGGADSAATGDTIISARFLRDNLIVSFTNSTWTYQITGITSPPFIFRRINGSKNISCPYAAVTYDERITNLGNTGFIACDGVNIQRFDIPVIDYYETQINQTYFNQDFAIKYDNLNQTWMFYPSTGIISAQFPPVEDIAPGSNENLVYNFLENTWCTYTNSFPMTCMGLFYVTSGTTWAKLSYEWRSTQAPWFDYSTQATAPMLLGGDTSGNIYHLDNQLAVRDGETTTEGSGTSFNVRMRTTRWNPFIGNGQKTQFGYIDIYYSNSSDDPDDPIVLTLRFFTDNSNRYVLERQLTLDGPVGSAYSFKRIYCNIIGQFIQMEIDPSEDAPIQILGFILWARPAGRLTPL